MSYFIGKGHTANYVILSPRHKKRLESMWKNARKNEISELEAHILYEQAKVEDLKKQFQETYGEDY